MLGLAIYSIRQTIADAPAKRPAHILLLVIGAILGVSIMSVLYALALGKAYPEVSMFEVWPVGVINGLALVELGPALKKAALKVLGRKSEDVANLTVTIDRPTTGNLPAAPEKEESP